MIQIQRLEIDAPLNVTRISQYLTVLFKVYIYSKLLATFTIKLLVSRKLL